MPSELESIRSEVNWIVLGLVIEKPSYGYEIAERFERRFGDCLQRNKRNVYNGLKTLGGKRLVEPVPGQAEAVLESQPKIRFRATAAGKQAYAEWVGEQLEQEWQRVALVGRLLSTGSLGDEELLAIFDRCAAGCLEESRRIGTAELKAGTHARSPARLELEKRRLALHTSLLWISFARKVISAGTESAGLQEAATR